MKPLAASPNISSTVSSDVPPLDWEDGEPEFKLFIVGGSGAGKTVLLACLNDFLSTPNEITYYYARLTGNAQEQYLKAKMNEIKTGTAWPLSDLTRTDYVFRCYYADPNSKETFPLFKFRCFDYPGGYLSDPTLGDLASLRGLAQSSHVAIFLIDGQKILDALQGRHIAGFSLDDELDVLAAFATECLFRPMQFVLTKADLIKSYPLSDVRQLLLGNQRFASIVNRRREARRPTYLIPVSAVGDNFVDYSPEKGSRSMVKRAEATPRPYNIDAMLALVISDTLLNSFKSSIRNSDKALILLLRLVIGLGPAVRFVANAGTVILNDGWAIRMLLLMERLTTSAARPAAVRKANMDKKLKSIRGKNSALTVMVEIQQLRVNDFLAKHLESDLIHEGSPANG